MRCLVVGAGLLGLTTAWFLRRHGCEVTLCERRVGPGLETSYANGGMLHASQASPWNEPGVLRQALATLGQEDSALLIRPLALLGMLPWAWSFFRHSAPASYLDAAARNARLADYSISVLNEHLNSLDLDFARDDRGTLKIYRDSQSFDSAQKVAERCREWDIPFSVLDSSEAVSLEPALTEIQSQLLGAIHFPGDVSGDAHRFCVELASRCRRAGVMMIYGSKLDRLEVDNGRFAGAMIDGQSHEFDQLVIAAGSYSAKLARSVGVRVPVQPVKGYSITVPLEGWSPAPRVPVIDEDFHAAVCPLGDQLRVAGTAEFAGFNTELRAARINNLFELLGQVYPRGAALGDRQSAEQWTGLRPMSPDGVGIMGATHVPGVYLNTGHGHLGWTMAPGAGKLVADVMTGHRPELAADDYAVARFTV